MHPTAEAIGKYARPGMVLEGELQGHLEECGLCTAIYRAEVAKALERLGAEELSSLTLLR